MASIKFRSNLAESSTIEVDDAYIDSGATPHFFQQRSIFRTILRWMKSRCEARRVLRKLSERGTWNYLSKVASVLKPIMLLDFCQYSFICTLEWSLRNSVLKMAQELPWLFLYARENFEIFAEYPLRGGICPLNLPSITRKAYTVYTRSKKLDEWHRKHGQVSSERLPRLSKMAEDVPPLDKEVRKHSECISCITAKNRRSAIPDSTRRTTRPLELVHLDISGKFEES